MADSLILRDVWLETARLLYLVGSMDKLTLRQHIGLSNKQLKHHTRCMKHKDIINCKEGVVWLTLKGELAFRHTVSLKVEASL